MTDVKKTILSRRARFLAAAIAGAGLAAGCSDAEPTACLSCVSPNQYDAAADNDLEGGTEASAEAKVCLSAPYDASVDGDAEPQMCLQPQVDASDEDALPQPCLDMPADATPEGAQMCLAPPMDGG